LKATFNGKSQIESEDHASLPSSFKIGSTSRIIGKRVNIDEDVSIGSNTVISATYISLGKGSIVEDNCRIMLNGEQSKFTVGDKCLIGSGSKIVVPVFETGDYVTLHNHALVNGYKSCKIGHNVWIGQNCILNATGNLTIGNNVGIGAYCSVWTHGFWGERIEGCQVYKIAPVIIEEGAFIEGSYNVISPGITVGRKAVVLTGSVVTKDVLPFSCVAGVPARDITEKVKPYAKVTLEQKYKMMRTFMLEFLDSIVKKEVTELPNGWRVKEDREEYEILFLKKVEDDSFEDDSPRIVITKKNTLLHKSYRSISIFDLSSKTYTKKRTEIESRVILFLFSNRARFTPNLNSTFNESI
jgi:acetyltransferase-like isoleucine patch superfamily enzyme